MLTESPAVVLEKLGLWAQSTCGPILTYHGQEGGYLETGLFWCPVSPWWGCIGRNDPVNRAVEEEPLLPGFLISQSPFLPMPHLVLWLQMSPWGPPAANAAGDEQEPVLALGEDEAENTGDSAYSLSHQPTMPPSRPPTL